MEQLTTRIGIEPGPGLVGRFGNTVIVIPRGETAGSAPPAAGPSRSCWAWPPRSAPTGRRRPTRSPAAWPPGLSATCRGTLPRSGSWPRCAMAWSCSCAARCGARSSRAARAREVSGEQALTWVDLIVPGTFEQLAIGGAAGRPVQADPLSDLWGGVVPGQGFVLSRTAGIPGTGFAESDAGLADSGAALADSGAARLRPGRVRCGRGCGRRFWRLRFWRLRVATVRGDTGAGDGPAAGGLGAPGRARTVSPSPRTTSRSP